MEHYEGLVLQYGPQGGLCLFCQVGLMYTRGIAGAAEARVAIQNARCREDIQGIVERWFGGA
jgi:hypothetical protein